MPASSSPWVDGGNWVPLVRLAVVPLNTVRAYPKALREKLGMMAWTDITPASSSSWAHSIWVGKNCTSELAISENPGVSHEPSPESCSCSRFFSLVIPWPSLIVPHGG